MRPEDLTHLVTPSDPHWHPDGRRLVFVRTRVDLDADRYERTIQLWDGDRVRTLTTGPADSHPRWSPDGSTLAFLRASGEPGAVAQVALLPMEGGDPRVVTDVDRGVADLAWSPDGRRLAIVARTWVTELADLDDDERGRRPRRITRLPYRVDGGGWVHERRQQLHLVENLDDEPTVRQVTDLRDDVSSPVWDGDRRLHALTRAHDLPETEPHDQVITVQLDGGNDDAAVAWGPTGLFGALQVDARGVLLVAGLPDPFGWPGANRVHELVEGELRDLTGHLDRDVLPNATPLAPAGPRAVVDGFVTVLEDRGTTRLVHVGHAADGEVAAVTELVGGQRVVTGLGVHPDGRTLAICWSDARTPGELAVVRDGDESPITSFGDAFRAEVAVATTERWTFERDDVDIDAWTVLPDGFDDAAERSVPVLVNIHGGPTSQYGDQFFDEFQVQAGAGYLVVGINPRGSSGRGTDWARAVVGTWADDDPVDALDLAAVADAVAGRYPAVDPERIGVMGGSYGGYATARLLAQDHRYRSAVVERGLLEWGSFSGTSDIGPYFDRMFLGASLADGSEMHHAASPLWRAHLVRTPTLVLHAAADWRCPVEQAERYFAALRTAGVDSELVIFPDEGHELSRSGTPRHRRERLELILDWHGRHLR